MAALNKRILCFVDECGTADDPVFALGCVMAWARECGRANKSLSDLLEPNANELHTADLTLTAQRYQSGHRIFDILLKRRVYHRFGTSQSSGVILICFFGEILPPRSSGIDLRADEGSPSHETGFRPVCRTTERLRQKQSGQAPSGNQGAARQRVHPEVHHREALQFFACQPRKLDEEARNQETEAVESYDRFETFALLGSKIT